MSSLGNFVWSIADQLRGVYRPNQRHRPGDHRERLVLRVHRDAETQDAGDVRSPRPRRHAGALPRLLDEAGHRGGVHPRRADRLPDLRHRFPDRAEGRGCRGRRGTGRRRGVECVGINDPEEIRRSFEPYYTDAFLETRTDPDLVHDLSAKLDQAGIFTDDEVDRAAEAWGRRLGNNALTAALAAAKQRFTTRYQTALAAYGGAGDKAALGELDQFRKDVATFVRLYDFMSQIVDYGDVDLEKRSIFLRLLERLIRRDNFSAEIDLSGVALVHVKQIDRGRRDLGLGERTGLVGTVAAGSAARKDPKMVAFQEVIDRLNDLFGDEEFAPAQKTSFVEGLLRTLLADETLMTQAQANSLKQFLDSPDLGDAVVTAVADNQGAHNKMADYFFGGSPQVARLVSDIGALVHAYAGQR